MTDHVLDMASVADATDRLIAAAGKLDDAALHQPCGLPGWSRGHVLAHIARNADALVNVLTSAHTGEHVPMYTSAEARDRDIEEGSARPLAAQLEDLTASATRFNHAAALLTPDQWQRTVELRNGVTDVAARVPFRRLAEVELHLVDLDAGYAVGDLPAGFVDAYLDYVVGERFAGRADVPALLVSTNDGEGRRTGRAEGDPVTVSGSPAALLGWLTGRTDGTGVQPSGPRLPALPPLG
ncbi:maleylpyruvate isomerase family mycothiol-dependent enzyme [Streptomyces meridianus]|uniref:Maleylpyruvate isomerase family mycothiol-dependent enzyme n=1 Tax=Streptomyces meridianus TaxID=2938945 RepID=A0ABT0X823_9ACTN|nr:maleylpyruvate isomerase family mycothiol-dependent enzyme [Streptomyces meridianus]MCM2578682.1 maleylpyruvate isomerase family mycothiol-dependent enzyme [Streptomyces meridianus]